MTQRLDPIGPGLPCGGQLFHDVRVLGGQVAAFEAVGGQVEEPPGLAAIGSDLPLFGDHRYVARKTCSTRGDFASISIISVGPETCWCNSGNGVREMAPLVSTVWPASSR